MAQNSPSPFDDDPHYARLFDRLARRFHRQSLRGVLFVGPRGIGKSILFVEFAQRAVRGSFPFLAGCQFISVDCRGIGPQESRHRLIEIMERFGPRPDVVLAIDCLGNLLRGEQGQANKFLLLSALERIQCRLLGILEPTEFQEFVLDDRDLCDKFEVLSIEEPSAEVARRILCHMVPAFEKKHGIKVPVECVSQIIKLSTNFILNERLPAKAIRILQQVCEDLDYDRNELHRPRDSVTNEDIVQRISIDVGVPEETLRGIADSIDYEQALREFIIGQEHAVQEVAKELGLIKAGLTEPDKPASVMLFVGQTGTGKTEMAKVLSRFYSRSKQLKIYTLGNYIEQHSVSAIIGVPPGYVGHDKGGRLVNELNSDPYGVFLLDEVDKTHPDVLQPFLNLFDEGWIVDQRGVRAYADRSIFILTSNVGQRMLAEMAQQGATYPEMASRMKDALSKIRHTKSNRPVFTPEFLARLGRVIIFQPLDRNAMEGICQKIIRELQGRFQESRDKDLIVAEDVIQHIAGEAHRANESSQGKEGGRIIKRLVADWITTCIQRAITENPPRYVAAKTVKINLVPFESEDSANAVRKAEVTFC